MNDEAGGQATEPVSLTDIWALRTDYEDVPVPQLGDKILRVYALTGTARAAFVGEMTGLSQADENDPETVRKVLEFQGRVVAASLGYEPSSWDGLGQVLGSQAVEELYEVAARLSGLDKKSQAEASDRLPTKRKAASGTG